MQERADFAMDTLPSPDLIPAIGPGGVLFPMEKLKAHQLGQLHVAVSVFVFCGDDLLIQQRAMEKYHCGGMWANTCCTHPHWGESIDDSAHRRLREEIGISLPLDKVGEVIYLADVGSGLTEHEHVHVFRADVPSRDLALDPESSEVSGTRWATREQLLAEARAEPQRFAPWFRIYLERWPELGLGA